MIQVVEIEANQTAVIIIIEPRQMMCFGFHVFYRYAPTGNIPDMNRNESGRTI